MYTCSCYFLDVGQGTSHFLYLGAGRAIIFDTGAPIAPNPNILRQALSDRAITQIEALIISHSDADHMGNAAYLLQNWIDKINKIYLVHDKTAETKAVKNFWSFLTKKFKEENGHDIRKKIAPFNAPQTVFEQILDGEIVKMEILFPTYSHAVDAELANCPNKTSAVTLFSVGNRKVLFTGDAPFPSFQWVHEEQGKVCADIVSVPHHGGNIGANPEQLKQLYSEYISGSLAVISVGNRNTHQHPNSETLTVLKNCGYEILCTQITEKCCAREKQEEWKQQRQYTGLEYSASSRNPSDSNVACMGTIQIDINAEAFSIVSPKNYHKIKEMLCQFEGATPRCLNH